MTNTHATSALAWQSELKRARTHRDHGAEEFLVLVAKAAEIVPQTDIAAQLHASQPQVSRWAAKGRVLLTPVQKGKLARSPYHAAQRFSRDEITRDQLVEFLTHWQYLDSEPRRRASTTTSSTWSRSPSMRSMRLSSTTSSTRTSTPLRWRP